MKTAVKLFCALIALSMVFSLVACGKSVNNTETSIEVSSSKPVPTTEETKKEPVKLKAFIMYGDDVRKAIYDKYLEPNTKTEMMDMEVEFELGSADYTDKIKTYNAAGEMPDVFFATGAATVKPLINAGNMLDLLPYITKDGFAGKFKDKVGIEPWKDGKLYSLDVGNGIYFTPRFFYHKDLFTKYNLTVPATFDDFMKVCKVLNDNGIIPMAAFAKSGWVAQQFLFQELVMSENPQAIKDLAENKAKWSDKIYVDALNKIQKMVLDGVFQKGLVSTEYGAAKELFTSKKAAMYAMMTWELPDLSKDPEVDFMVFPQTNANVDNNQIVMHYGAPLGGYAVFSKSQNVEEAVKLAEFFTEQEAKYFIHDQKAPVLLDIGEKIEGLSPLMEKNLAQFDAASNKVSCIATNGFNTKTAAETGVLFEKLLTGKYSGEQFAKDIEKTWSENFTE